jgi:hypothetical protein
MLTLEKKGVKFKKAKNFMKIFSHFALKKFPDFRVKINETFYEN